ncbi:MAG: AAA family ATPase, partial [Planctomycetota bacterium]
RRAAVPLVGISTPDPRATMETLVQAVNGKSAVVCWDIIAGLRAVNDEGRQAVASVNADDADGNPVGFLEVAAQLPDGTVAVFLQADAWLSEPPVIQGVWNLRDPYKQSRRMLVLLGSQIQPPAALQRDIVVLDEELPDQDTLSGIVKDLDTAASEGAEERPIADEGTVQRAVEATQGLSAFAAEQAVAMALRPDGIDLDHLWENKRALIELTPGLSVWRGGERFGDVGGLANVKEFMGRILNGNDPPRGVVFVDEIEKMLAGSAGGAADTSGVSQGILQALLTHMQDHGSTGCIFIGPPGAGKSMVAKTVGNEGNIPTIALDAGAMKGSLVGESEKAVREALKVVSAVTSDQALWVATCNSIGSLPPELRRRFSFGTFFFDLPDEEEREGIWRVYRDEYPTVETGPYDTATEFDIGWTGAEIKTCCLLAYRLKISLAEAANYIVPVCKSARAEIDNLRQQADGRFISASYPGPYRVPEKGTNRRAVTV